LNGYSAVKKVANRWGDELTRLVSLFRIVARAEGCTYTTKVDHVSFKGHFFSPRANPSRFATSFGPALAANARQGGAMGASHSMYRASRSLLGPLGRHLHARALWPPSAEHVVQHAPVVSAVLALVVVGVRLVDTRLTREDPVHPPSIPDRVGLVTLHPLPPGRPPYLRLTTQYTRCVRPTQVSNELEEQEREEHEVELLALIHDDGQQAGDDCEVRDLGWWGGSRCAERCCREGALPLDAQTQVSESSVGAAFLTGCIHTADVATLTSSSSLPLVGGSSSHRARSA
jgi:hypothetical protein